MQIFTHPSQAERKLRKTNRWLEYLFRRNAPPYKISEVAKQAMEISTELVICLAIENNQIVCIDADRVYNADYAFSAELHADEFGVLHSKHNGISLIL